MRSTGCSARQMRTTACSVSSFVHSLTASLSAWTCSSPPWRPAASLRPRLGCLPLAMLTLLFRDPDWLAVQFEMLRAFFAPYSDAPATVTKMTRGLQASLPAVMPCAEQTLDKRFAAGQHDRPLERAQGHAGWAPPRA